MSSMRKGRRNAIQVGGESLRQNRVARIVVTATPPFGKGRSSRWPGLLGPLSLQPSLKPVGKELRTMPKAQRSEPCPS